MRLLRLALCAALAVNVACGGAATPVRATSTPTDASAVATATPTVPAATATAARTATPTAAPSPMPIDALLDRIDARKMDDHLRALVAAGSRDVRHAGHAKAVAYLYEQLRAIPGLEVQTHRAVHQGIPLENIFAVVDPPGGAPPTGWVMVSAHYDSISNRTPGWDPRTTPAPGADDNATGTAALLEYARILAAERSSLRERVVLGFFDGEELFYKGSAAYVAGLPRPYPYKAAVNIDMVGFNPIADRLDLLWYTNASAGLRDRVIATNQKYAIGVSPLNAQFAADGTTIMDAAPFGLAGIPSVALCQRYGENDATFPGNASFHTRNDTEDKLTNRRLWLKAAKLTLAVALELARER